VLDRQTDGRTDSFLVASPRWHSMQRGINVAKNERQKRVKPVSQIRSKLMMNSLISTGYNMLKFVKHLRPYFVYRALFRQLAKHR